MKTRVEESKSARTVKIGTRLFVALCAVALSAGLYGCAKKGPSSDVIATVNGKPITVKRFKTEMAKLPPQLQSYIQTPEGEKKFITSLVERQILVNEAIKEGINKTDAYKDQVSDFKKGMLVQLLLKKEVADKINVTDAQAEAFYKSHYLSFNLPSMINVSYVQTNSMKQAEAVYALLQKGEPFASVAEKYSTAPNRKSGGVLGWIKFEQTTPSFNNAAFSIPKIGDYSKIVKVGGNFDVIRLNNARTGKPKPFETVKNEIIMIMKQQEGTKMLKDFVDGLKSKSKIKYFYGNLPSFPAVAAPGSNPSAPEAQGKAQAK